MHPTYWPEVRRGAERLVHDLAGWLAESDHDVSILTTHRALGVDEREEGVNVRRSWRPPDRVMRRRAYEDHLATIPVQLRDLLRGDFDVAHAFFPVSAWAALKAQALGGPPVVSTLTGIPTRGYLVARRYRLAMNLEVARHAAGCSVLSQAAAQPFRRYLLREADVIPPGVRCADFALSAERAPRPTVVYAGSPSDPRKRVSLLFEAFAELRQRRPDARLLLAGRPEPWFELDLPDGVEWAVVDDPERLARVLASAHVAVLPAIEEGFGLVLIEALAAGTPIVAARSGACPEVVTDDVGRLFEGDDAGAFVDALEAVLEMGDVRDACRAHAARWDWGVVGPRYEALLQAATEQR